MGYAIHYYVHGCGLGHASRSVPVVRALRAEGNMVRVFAGEAAGPMFAAEPGGSRAIASTPLGVCPSTARVTASRLQQVMAALRMDNPRVVVTDGDLPSAVAARLNQVPTVALGHGLVFGHCKRTLSAPRMPWIREALKARMASLGASRVVAVNFAACEPIDPRKTTVAAPTLRETLGQRSPVLADDAPVVCYFRDDNGDAIVRTLVELGTSPLVFTNREDVDLPGATVVARDGRQFAHVLPSARAVVSSAGSQLISECQGLGVPQLALYAAGDDEQQLNVAMLRHFGLGDGAPMGSCDRGMLEAFLGGVRKQPGHGSAAPPVDTVSAILRAVADLVSR